MRLQRRVFSWHSQFNTFKFTHLYQLAGLEAGVFLAHAKMLDG